MNIVSTMVGISIMGAAAPMVLDMSIAPMIAQKRAQNFGVAESRAVAYAALNEGAPEITPVPDGCDLVQMENVDAYMITCTEGLDKFKQSVSRSFKLADLCSDNDANNGHGNSGGYDCRSGAQGTRKAYTPGVFCPLWDPWGVINYNESHNVQCIPVPYGPWASTYTGEMLW